MRITFVATAEARTVSMLVRYWEMVGNQKVQWQPLGDSVLSLIKFRRNVLEEGTSMVTP